mmetsp:Transcript_39265/g.45035  ORF Transcript_39265/g.45035 Transcript_39265/m.45035 type:complete len:90 (+) Transcript_39265:1429-1698(+)
MEQQELSIKDAIGSLNKLFTDYVDLLKAFILTNYEQATLIECIEKYCIDNARIQSGFHLLLQILWKTKLLSNKAIIEWSELNIENPHVL